MLTAIRVLTGSHTGCKNQALWQRALSRHPRRPRGGQLRREEINRARSRLRFTSKAEIAPGSRLLSDHFQMALSMLPPDWAEKSFVLFCPIVEQQLLRYCGVSVHDDFRIAILASFMNVLLCEGNFHFNFLKQTA